MKNNKYETVTEIFEDKSVRAIGIIADVNQGKSNTIYHSIKELHRKYEDKIYSYGLHLDIDGVTKINMIEELEGISNSFIFIDEYQSLFSVKNARQREKFEASMRTIFQHKWNNTVVICGLPHNFDKFLSGILQVLVFKQCRLEDFIQRSSAQQAVASFSPEGLHLVSKGSTILKMPKNVALIYDVAKPTAKWSEVEVPYEKDCDTKALYSAETRVPRSEITDEKINARLSS